MNEIDNVSINSNTNITGANAIEWLQPKKVEDHLLKQMIRSSYEILATAKTVFPFTLFPHTITLDRTKVTIIKRNFILSSETVSFRIEDILNVSVNVTPFFGSIKILTRVFGTEKPYQVDHFKRGEAIHLKHIIQGYLIAARRNIDCSTLEHGELINLLGQLGHDPTG